MSLRELYIKVDFKKRQKIIAELLQPQTFHSKYVHPFTIEVDSDFKLVEEAILNHTKFNDDEKFNLIFLSKDLLNYTKDTHSIFNYTIMRRNKFGFETEFPLLVLKFNKFADYQKISLPKYKEALESETTILARIVNFFLE